MTEEEFTDEDKREINFHDFDTESEVVGTLISIDKGVYGDQYKIEEGKDIFTVGTYEVLKYKINESDIGKRIKIVYNGEKDSEKGGKKYKDFTVYIK